MLAALRFERQGTEVCCRRMFALRWSGSDSQFRTHKHILASIHIVIRRLEKGGEIRKAIHDIQNGADKSVYLWAGPNYGASNSLANQMADADRDRLRRKN